MKKILAVFISLMLPLVASATCTWTSTSGTSSTVVCTTGNESAPSAITDGIALQGCSKGVAFFVSADSGQTLSGAGAVRIYVYDPDAGRWGELYDEARTISVGSRRDYALPGLYIYANNGRVAAIPSGVTISSGGVTIYTRCQ